AECLPEITAMKPARWPQLGAVATDQSDPLSARQFRWLRSATSPHSNDQDDRARLRVSSARPARGHIPPRSMSRAPMNRLSKCLVVRVTSSGIPKFLCTNPYVNFWRLRLMGSRYEINHPGLPILPCLPVSVFMYVLGIACVCVRCVRCDDWLS